MRFTHPGFKIASLVAALFIVSACKSSEAPTSTTGGGGGAVASTIVPGSQEDLAVTAGDSVFFDYDQYNLRPEGQATLQAQAAWLSKYPQVTLTLEGHCDERGTREYNLALGERRANAVRDFLINLGVTPDRITTISYGKERPVATCSDESCWSQNRRGVTVVQ